jgi:SnoaL-like domain
MLQTGQGARNADSALEVCRGVALIYDAHIGYPRRENKYGDFSEVPLADDFEFTGPVASFGSAEGYRAMAGEAGQAVTSFTVRRQFADGDTVCSIIDWEMALPGVGRMTSAELLQVVDGVIVRGELIYDGEALRRAMAQPAG